MKLEHGFTVPVPVAKAWDVLLDVPTVAPCMPGAALTSYEGDEFTGTVKVKVGPINLTYKGQGRIVERNEAERRAILQASGRESRGGSTAKATVTATLRSDGDGSTRVDVVTDLNITGRPAQFGRGMMVDIGNKLIGQFAQCLSRKVREAEVSGVVAAEAAAETAAAQAATVEPAAPAVSETAATTGAGTAATPAGQEVEPIDLLRVTGAGEMAKRVAKYTVVFAVGVLIGWLLSRLGRS
ncbi:MAG TPA: SRPBCC family protein [Micromonosporaceae bacterium]|jgi:carbon monoxide dehydrogenase subunit G|nr:SRPBCC family protein [Micromonosporaceae bacterium]